MRPFSKGRGTITATKKWRESSIGWSLAYTSTFIEYPDYYANCAAIKLESPPNSCNTHTHQRSARLMLFCGPRVEENSRAILLWQKILRLYVHARCSTCTGAIIYNICRQRRIALPFNYYHMYAYSQWSCCINCFLH